MAIDLLRRTSCRNFVILEKGSQVGGTWHDNKYPGCACDGMCGRLRGDTRTRAKRRSLEHVVQLLVRAEERLDTRVSGAGRDPGR